MATNRQVVTDALIELTVLDANETAANEDAELGLRVMNRMFALLSADGIDLGYTIQNRLSDDFPLDETVQAQIHYILAVALRPSFPSAQPDPTLFSLAAASKSQLVRDAVIENREESRLSHMPLGERAARLYDVFSDN